MITQEELKEQLKYNKKTGIFTWLVANSNNVQIGDIAGYKNKRGYIYIGINGKIYRAHRLAWLYVHGYMPENGLDHRNRKPWDNRIKNLREVSQQCNMRNSKGIYKSNTSGVKGVYWYKRTNKWHAQMGIGYKNKKQIVKYLGQFDNFLEAVCHRFAAEQCLGFRDCNTESTAGQYIREHINNAYTAKN